MIEAQFCENLNEVTTSSLFQYDTGQKLKISGITTTATTIEVHFANSSQDTAIVKQAEIVDNAIFVDIPNIFLEGSGSFCKAWIYVIDENSARTIKTIYIPIESRKKPDGFITPSDPDTKNLLKKAIEIIEGNTTKIVQVGTISTMQDLIQYKEGNAEYRGTLTGCLSSFNENYSNENEINFIMFIINSGQTMDRDDEHNKTYKRLILFADGSLYGFRSSSKNVPYQIQYSKQEIQEQLNQKVEKDALNNIPTLQTSESDNNIGGLDIADKNGNVIMRITDHISTQNFSSAEFVEQLEINSTNIENLQTATENQSITIENCSADIENMNLRLGNVELSTAESDSKVEKLSTQIQDCIDNSEKLNNKLNNLDYETGGGNFSVAKDLANEGSFTYTKIGNLVTIFAKFNVRKKDETNSFATFSGLPYKIKSHFYSTAVGWQRANNASPVWAVSETSVRVQPYNNLSPDVTDLYCTFSYFTE